MMLLIGLATVALAVAGGYMIEGGQILLLVQPAELLIIGGAATGTMLIGTPMPVLKALLQQCKRLFSAAQTERDFGELLAMLYQLFRVVQRTGVMALENHFESPAQSAILSKYPRFLANHCAVSFLADSGKVIIAGGISTHDLDHLMTEDLEVRHRNELQPAAALTKIGDALPGFGIVAAILGVVLTMQAIDGPPSEIGHKVGAALVGTFLGILLSYGVVQPLAATLEARVNDESYIEQCLKAGLLAMYKGLAPAIAVEFARRAIPEDLRPSFEAAERLCQSTRAETKAA